MDSALQKKRNKNIDFIRNTYHSSLKVVACWCPSSFTRLIPAESAKRKKRKEIFSEILCMVHTLRLRYFHHIAISGWASNVHIFSCVWNGFREIQPFRELTWLRQFSKWNQRSKIQFWLLPVCNSGNHSSNRDERLSQSYSNWIYVPAFNVKLPYLEHRHSNSNIEYCYSNTEASEMCNISTHLPSICKTMHSLEMFYGIVLHSN